MKNISLDDLSSQISLLGLDNSISDKKTIEVKLQDNYQSTILAQVPLLIIERKLNNNPDYICPDNDCEKFRLLCNCCKLNYVTEISGVIGSTKVSIIPKNDYLTIRYFVNNQ